MDASDSQHIRLVGAPQIVHSEQASNNTVVLEFELSGQPSSAWRHKLQERIGEIAFRGSFLEVEAPKDNLSGFLDDLAQNIEETNALLEGQRQVEEWWSARVSSASEQRELVAEQSTAPQRPAEPSSPSTRWWPTTAVALGVGLVVIVGVLAWIGSRTSAEASWWELEADECFNYVPEPADWIGVEVIPCSEPHHAQALLWEPLGDGPFPGDAVLNEEGLAACDRTVWYAIQPSAFEDVAPRFIAPQEQEWEQAQNSVLCLVEPNNEPTMVGSVSTLVYKADAEEIETVVVTDAAVTQGPVSVWELSPGTCLTDPGVESWPDVVNAIPCTDPHDIEVHGIGRWPDQATYPEQEVLVAAGTWYCLAQFSGYSGIDFVEATVEIGVLVPDEAEWADDRRRLTCMLTSGTDEPLTRSYRETAAG